MSGKSPQALAEVLVMPHLLRSQQDAAVHVGRELARLLLQLQHAVLPRQAALATHAAPAAAAHTTPAAAAAGAAAAEEENMIRAEKVLMQLDE